jgi:plasmid maintenance system antidote protein VapI
MTLEQLYNAGYALYGEHWQKPLAHALGIRERTVYHWLGERNGMPGDLAARIDAVFGHRIDELRDAREKLRSEARAA